MSTSPAHPIAGGPLHPLPAPGPDHRFSERARSELEEIASHYPERKAACLPALWIAQREYGGALTAGAIQEVADLLGLSFTEVEGVATYYTMYNLRPVGAHHLEVCTCLTCALVGAYDVVHAIEGQLGIHIGQTTPDGEFTLSEVECLDMCGAATVMQVGDRYFTNVTASNVINLIEELRTSEKYTPQRLADSIVQVHIPGASERGGGSYAPGEI